MEQPYPRWARRIGTALLVAGGFWILVEYVDYRSFVKHTPGILASFKILSLGLLAGPIVGGILVFGQYLYWRWTGVNPEYKYEIPGFQILAFIFAAGTVVGAIVGLLVAVVVLFVI